MVPVGARAGAQGPTQEALRMHFRALCAAPSLVLSHSIVYVYVFSFDGAGVCACARPRGQRRRPSACRSEPCRVPPHLDCVSRESGCVRMHCCVLTISSEFLFGLVKKTAGLQGGGGGAGYL
jgi:hypothetical protein